eukprot:801767-Heterocapsa_arctica.AAC.1
MSARAYLSSKGKKKENLEKNGKLLTYHKLASAMQKMVDEARLEQWTGYLKFGAVKIISSKEAKDLVMSTNAEELPTKWIDVDKHEFLRMLGDTKVDPK